MGTWTHTKSSTKWRPLPTTRQTRKVWLTAPARSSSSMQGWAPREPNIDQQAATRRSSPARAHPVPQQAATQRTTGGVASPHIITRECSCLGCCVERSRGGHRETVTYDENARPDEYGYVPDLTGDWRRSVRVVLCHQCRRGRWYREDHMWGNGWYNPEYWRRTCTNKWWCTVCWPLDKP